MSKFFLTKTSDLLQNMKKKTSFLKNVKYQVFNRPYTFFKPVYNSIIPLDIYQTWKTKDLPENMKLRVEELKRTNPRFNHYLYDDNDCKEFIKNNFDEIVLDTYNRLIPGAYKADLWRYCILYKKGGIYLDIKLKCINNFRLIELTEREHLVKDRWNSGIYNALMVCKPGNELLLKAINKIVQNVKDNFYGESPLHPTGPSLLRDIINYHKIYNVNIDLLHDSGDFGLISYKKRFVFSTTYPEYDSERNEMQRTYNTSRYDVLWNNHEIYKN
jgi:mannosyltransferase OCH1-like enzyme